MSGRGFQPPVQDLLSNSHPSPLAYLTLRVLLRTCSHNSACRVLRAAELELKPGAPGEPSVSFGAESLGQALPSSGEGPPVLSPPPLGSGTSSTGSCTSLLFIRSSQPVPSLPPANFFLICTFLFLGICVFGVSLLLLNCNRCTLKINASN